MKRKKRRVQPSTIPGLSESELELAFLTEWRLRAKVPLTQQHKFHPVREWRFDFCILEEKLAIEIQGLGPGHQSKEGMKNDYAKHNEAILLGWRIVYIMGYQLTPRNITKTIDYVRRFTRSEVLLPETSRPRDKWENLSAIDRLRSKLDRGSNQ